MRHEVRTEVIGKAWQVHAAPGASVEAGASLLTVESMKMEIPAPAPHAERIVEIRVGEEEMVAEGQTVAIIET